MIGTTEHYPAALQDSSGHSGVSWAAIFAGAAAAAALSLLLLAADVGRRLGLFSRIAVVR